RSGTTSSSGRAIRWRRGGEPSRAGDEADVGVLERRLPGRDPANPDVAKAAEQLLGQLQAFRGLDEQQLDVFAFLDRDRGHAGARAHVLEAAGRETIRLDLPGRPVGGP